MLDNWYHAFDALQDMLAKKRKRKSKLILFFDELPWLDTGKNEFVAAFEDFWNGWASLRDNVMLIATGSATSWMVNNIVENQGGLYNRVTCKIHLRQFTLNECELYLRAHDCNWDRYAIVQYYMYLGGVPFYLSLLDYHKSLEENIDDLFFSPTPKLENEFNDLYNVLFAGAHRYIDVVRLLAQRREGMTIKELADKTSNGGWLSQVITNLERCDFIHGYQQYGNRKKGTIYRLTDFFTIFYLRFVEKRARTSTRYWNQMALTPQVIAWQGFTFEQVCLTHIAQIKQQLGIAGMLTTECAWRSRNEQTVDPSGRKRHAQIDLVIERTDRQIHLCEMKFSQEPYNITKDYEQQLRDKMAVFRADTKTRKALIMTFITTFGLRPSTHTTIVRSQLTIDALFEPLL